MRKALPELTKPGYLTVKLREERDQLIREAVAELDEMPVQDPERAHGLADAILLSMVPADVRHAYLKLQKRSPWWADA